MGQWIDFAEIRSRISLEDVILRYYQITTLRLDGRRLTHHELQWMLLLLLLAGKFGQILARRNL